MNQRIAVIGILVLVVLGFGVVQMNSKNEDAMDVSAIPANEDAGTSDALVGEPAPTPMATPEVTANFDDLVAEMTLETSAESALLSDAASDKALLTSDTDALQGYTTTYDETAL